MPDLKISELPASNTVTDAALVPMVPEGVPETRRVTFATLRAWINGFLGNAAQRNVGTAANTVAAGDDSRITNAVQPNWVSPVANFSASETALAEHRNTLRRCTAAAGVTVTLPAMPVGSTIAYLQAGAGAITFVAGAGQTVTALAGALTTAGQHAKCSAQVVATDTWHVAGAMVA